LLSVTAERGGLHASATRTVAFEDAPAWLENRHETATRVEATAIDATVRAASTRAGASAGGGGTAGDVFEAVVDAYDALGAAGEWRNHHQGGAAGYAGREWIASPGSDQPVESPMAYAYNPTVSGAKSEDTVLVTDDGAEVLTRTGEWPTRSAASRLPDSDFAVDRPAVLALDDERA
jgi:Xaa-Pro aminopeptidase